MPKVTKKKKNETKDEKIKRLEKENLYLKAELEYSKKLRPLFKQGRINNRRKSKCCKRTSANISINDSSKSIWFSKISILLHFI